jgi:haloalkane dehalogenase
MLPVLLDAGCRVVAPDLVGFGRSDKPAQVGDHTYARHVKWLRAHVLDELDLADITLVCQDWGGLLGLRLVAEHPDLFAAVVAANTGLPTGDRPMPDVWWQFRQFVERTEDLPVGFLVDSGCLTDLGETGRAAYEAPFPGPEYKAGPRAMPLILPTGPDDPAAEANRAAWEALGRFEQPFVCAFSDSDPITAGADRHFREAVPGAAGREHPVIAGGGHFLQEDRGPELARVVLDVVRSR